MKMRKTFMFTLLIAVFTASFLNAQNTKARLIVLADMGHDPDEEQQITHLLMCSNEFNLEGLVAVTGRFFRKIPPDTVKRLMPHLFHRLIDGYEKVYPNLQLHASGYKSPDYLRSIVARGQEGNGMKDVGKGRASAGSKLITKAALKDDPRPLYLVVNSGANTLAQALYDFRESHTASELKVFLSKLRVFDNGGQDESGAWICHEFPDLFYIRSNVQTRAYGGPKNNNLGPYYWHPYDYSPEGQHKWAKEHIQTNHGALGELYPDRYVGMFHYVEGGGTVPWLGFVTSGLSDLSKPHWGGWSGRYSEKKIPNAASAYSIVQPDELKYEPFSAFTDAEGIVDNWTDPTDGKVYENEFAPVWRWRWAMWNDLIARMDWCVEKYVDANHHPIAAINGDIDRKVHFVNTKPGQELKLNATASFDPDGDNLEYKWWIYREAGTYNKEVPLGNTYHSDISFMIPTDASGHEVHLILEVHDNNEIADLYDYRRIVIEVR
ncbi:MAG: DUF1593 domain-containing protein [Cyclobacteriaceae bacterium]